MTTVSLIMITRSTSATTTAAVVVMGSFVAAATMMLVGSSNSTVMIKGDNVSSEDDNSDRVYTHGGCPLLMTWYVQSWTSLKCMQCPQQPHEICQHDMLDK